MPTAEKFDHVDYERRGDVGVWQTTDFAALMESDELPEAEAHYRQEASDPEMDATVVVINNAGALGDELQDTLDHVELQWSQLADEVGVDKAGYVAEGIISWTVQSKIDADVETSSFETVEEAVAWAQD
jgi:hypothetical protein